MATFTKNIADLSITKVNGDNVKIVKNGCFKVDDVTYKLKLVAGINKQVTEIKIEKWEKNKWGDEMVKKITELSKFFNDSLTVSDCPDISPQSYSLVRKPKGVVGTNPIGITEEEREEKKKKEEEEQEEQRQRILALQQNSANFRERLKEYQQGVEDDRWNKEMYRKMGLLSRGLNKVMRENTTYNNLSEEEKKDYINKVKIFASTQAEKKDGNDCLANVQQLPAAQQEDNLLPIATTCIAAYDKYISIPMSGARRRNRTKHRRSRHKRTRRYRKN